jgi:hypothetical protein
MATIKNETSPEIAYAKIPSNIDKMKAGIAIFL